MHTVDTTVALLVTYQVLAYSMIPLFGFTFLIEDQLKLKLKIKMMADQLPAI